MPKSIYEITDFSKGLVNNSDARDIEKGTLHKLDNAIVSSAGKIRMMGQEVPHGITQTNAISAGITAWYGLEVFKSDFPFTRGIVNGNILGPQEYGVTSGTENYLPVKGEAVITGAGTTWNARSTVRVTCSFKHMLSTLCKVKVNCVGNSNFNTSGGEAVQVVNDYTFDYASDVSYVSDQPINWICDPSIIESEISDYASMPEPSSGSFTFLVLQNLNHFHLYQSPQNRFFEGAGSIVSAQSSSIMPVFNYIDDALRICDGNFQNLNSFVGSNQKDYSPNWFGYLPKKKHFKLEALNDENEGCRIVQAGWRSESNNVYDANCVLAEPIYYGETFDSADKLFEVSNSGTDDQTFADTGNGSKDMLAENPSAGTPMKVWMNCSPTGADTGNWLMSDGGDHENLRFGIAYIYDEAPYEQESRIFKSTTDVVANTQQDHVGLGFEIKVYKDGWPARVTGFTIYLYYASGELNDPLRMGTCYFNKDKGWVGHDGTVALWETDNGGNSNVSQIRIYGDSRMKEYPTETYWYRNTYEHNLATATHRYKTAAIVNNKLYAGNVLQVGGLNHNTVYQDRMLVSRVQKYDILSPSSELDVATSDGDEIMKLVAFGNKLLQFKRDKLYIIFCGDVDEKIESVHNNMGIPNIDAVCEFDLGVAFCNNNGVFVYDGKQVVSLIQGKIDLQFWRACLGNGGHASVGYVADRMEIVIYFNNNPYDSERIDSLFMDQSGEGDIALQNLRNSNLLVYNIPTDSWSFGSEKGSAELKTNMINKFDNKLIFGIGNGVYSESHSAVVVEGNSDAPAVASGGFQFSRGKWDDTYSHCWIYNEDNAAWQYAGEVGYPTTDFDLAAETNSDMYADYLAGELMDSISQMINNFNNPPSLDEFGNALEPSYELRYSSFEDETDTEDDWDGPS